MEPTRTTLLATLAAMTSPIAAQDPAGSDIRRELAELRQKNEALEARVSNLEANTQSGGEYGSGLSARYGDVTATFQVFGDVGFEYRNPEDPGMGNSNFFLGSVDFFANVQFGDRFRVLSESVLDARGGETISIDQERLWCMWTVDDGLYAKLGTEHSPVSRWNQLYHHGHWLETSISRPLMAEFEGGEGILAMHATGLELGGRLPTGSGGLEWFVTVANGRGLQPTNKQRTADRNDSKKIDAGLAFMPSAVPDLRVGTAFTYDEIPPDPASTVPGRGQAIREFVATAHSQYRGGPFDLLAEVAWIEHDVREPVPSAYHHHAGYVQVAWRAGSVTPYARMDYRQMEQDDPFYVSSDRDLDSLRPLVGVRYDATENVATKLEFAFEREELRGAGAGDRDVLSVALQVSWVL